MISPFYVFAYSTKPTGAELEKWITNNENNVTKIYKIPHKRRKKVANIYCVPAMRETRVRSLGQEDSLEKEMATHSVFLPGTSHEWRSLVAYSPRGGKESDTTERLHFTMYLTLCFMRYLKLTRILCFWP